MTRARVAVIIPVHNEQELLERCLRSVAAASSRIDGGVRTVVVLDACDDGSCAIAERWPVEVVRIDAHSVGLARRAGVQRVLGHAPTPLSDTWLAHTDADSEVPADWIQAQLDARHAGAEVFVGGVRPDFSDLSPAHIAQWTRTHDRGQAIGHVHGANLGILARVYLAAGGFPPVSEHEDVLLVERARALGATVIASDACDVLTSGRLTGRTPGGYAAHLAGIARGLAQDPVY